MRQFVTDDFESYHDFEGFAVASASAAPPALFVSHALSIFAKPMSMPFGLAARNERREPVLAGP